MRTAITATIGTLALAAGIGLSACGGGGSSSSSPAPGAPAGHAPTSAAPAASGVPTLTTGNTVPITWASSQQGEGPTLSYKVQYTLNSFTLSQQGAGPQPCLEQGAECIPTTSNQNSDSAPAEQFLVLDLTIKNTGTQAVPTLPEQHASWIAPGGTMTNDVMVNFPAQTGVGPTENEPDANVVAQVNPGQIKRVDLEYTVPDTSGYLVFTLTDPNNGVDAISQGTNGITGGQTQTIGGNPEDVLLYVKS